MGAAEPSSPSYNINKPICFTCNIKQHRTKKYFTHDITQLHNYSTVKFSYELLSLFHGVSYGRIVRVHFGCFFFGAVFNARNICNSSIASPSPIRFRWKPRWRWIWDLLLWWLQRLETIPQMMVKTMVIDPMLQSQKITLNKQKQGR